MATLFKLLFIISPCFVLSSAVRHYRVKRGGVGDAVEDGGVTYRIASDVDLSTYKIAEYRLAKMPTPVLFDTNDPHSRLFIAFIDGTENNKFKNPANSLTNVAMIYDQMASINDPKIQVEYQPGVGSVQDNTVTGKLDAAFGITMKESIQSMYTKFIKQVAEWKKEDPNVKVSFVGVGFSNGAIQIAALSRMIHEMGSQDPKNARIVYEISEDDYRNKATRVELKTVYDGEPVLNAGTIPQALLPFDPVATNTPESLLRNIRTSSSVVSAYMPNARDDRRALFDLAPLVKSNDFSFLETTLAGAHSDIGGGSGGYLNGLTTLSGNLGRKYLNKLFNKPLLNYASIPTSSSEFVIHHAEDYYWFYKFGLRNDRGIENKFDFSSELTDKNLLSSLLFRTDPSDSGPYGVKEYKNPDSSIYYYEIANNLNPSLRQEIIRMSPKGILLSQTITYFRNLNPFTIETLSNNNDGTYSILTSRFDANFGIANIANQKFDLFNNIDTIYTTVLGSLRVPSLSPNLLYIDESLNNWAAVSRSTGVSIEALLSANPSFSIVSRLPPGIKINLPSVDNTLVPNINVVPDPQAKQETKSETDAISDIQNGYAHLTPTSSIMFSNGELDSSKFTDTQRASLTTGHLRPGNLQLDPNPRPPEYLWDNLDFLQWYSNINGIALNTLIFGSVEQIFVDPILLDLNGDGVRLTNQQDGVLFDVDNSGQKSRTGWSSRQDGFLVFDFNGDGIISSISEMFSEYTNGTKGIDNQPGTKPYANGWAALAKYDSNRDNFIDYLDRFIWNSLKVWIDANHDGKSWIDENQNDRFDVGETSELVSVIELGIIQIDLNVRSAEVGSIRDGNRLLSIGRYRNRDSIEMEAVDVNLISDEAHHLIVEQPNGKVIVSQSLGNNSTIMVKSFFSQSQNSTSILNATELDVSNLYGSAANDTLIAHGNGSWLVGGPGSNTYKGGVGDDVLVISASDQQDNIDGGPGTNTAIFTGDKPITLNMALANVQIAQAGHSDAVIISGGRTGIFMKGGSGFNTLIGGSGDDVIVGGRGKNLIIGGRGKSVIHAGTDDDTIYASLNDSIINLGGGWDQVFGKDGNDVIKVGTGNASIDGGGGINIIEFQGGYSEYHIEKLVNQNESEEDNFEYRIKDLVKNRNGVALLKRIQRLTFSDISAIGLNEPNAMPVPDVLHVNECLTTANGEKIILILASKILSNDHLFGSVGRLRIRSVSDPIGGSVRLTNSNEAFALASGQVLTTEGGNVLFTCDPLHIGQVRQFKYGVVDEANNPSLIVLDLNSGETAPIRAKVTLVYDENQLSSTSGLQMQQNYLNDIHVYDVWSCGYTGKGVRIGQFEPGGPFSTEPEVLDYTHPDLAPNIDKSYLKAGLESGKLPTVFSDHATRVAGVMVAMRNEFGITGIAYGATLAGYYLANEGSDFATLSRVSNFDIVNHSWGFTVDFGISNIISNLLDTRLAILSNLKNSATNGRGTLGTMCVIAGGNSRAQGGSAQGSFMSNSQFCIQVAAVNYLSDLSTLTVSSQPFSNPGASILISAPGNQILSTSLNVVNDLGAMLGNKFDKSTGTSFATPIVSACVALILEANPMLTYRDVQTILATSAYIIKDPNTTWTYNSARNWNGGGMHTSHDYGFGHIDVRAAVRLAETWLVNLPSNDKKVSEATSGTLNLTAPCSASFTFRYSSSYFNSPNLKIEHVEVDVEISFAYFGDVTIVLVSPSRTQSVLLDRPGKVPRGFRNYSSADLGDKRSGELQYTFMSTRHWGEKSHGEWKLIVSDATSNTTAVKLIRWSLRIYGEELGVDNTYIYTDEYEMTLSSNLQRKLLDDSLNGEVGGRNTLNAAAISGNVSLDMLNGRATLNGVALNIRNASTIQNLISGDGNDVLVAGNEKSVLYAGRGKNSLTGGQSNDIFVVMAGKGRRPSDSDTIYAFNATQGDKILIVGLKCKKFNDLSIQQINNSRDIRISWSSLNESQNILVKNVFVNELNSQNVILQQMLKLPTSYLKAGSQEDLIVVENTAVIKLNRSIGPTWITLWDNRWFLEGVLFKRDANSLISRFVILPVAKDAKKYGNAIQGFIPGTDKIDLSLLGIKRFADVALEKRNLAIVNGVAIITATDIKAYLPTESPNEIVTLAYLDSIDPSQLTERDFILADSMSALEGADLNCIDVCQSNPCYNNGTCSRSQPDSDEFVCICASGYYGDRCQNLTNMCSPTNPCQNEGICSQNGPNSFKCSCRNGTYGELCQNVINLCLNYTCQNNGSCVQTKPYDEPKCSCRYGFQGTRCETVTSMCEPNNPCVNNGTCEQTAPGAFICTCLNGFNGTYCEQIASICDLLKPCLNEEICNQVEKNTFKCTCPIGYEGARCELKSIETTTTGDTTTTKSVTATSTLTSTRPISPTRTTTILTIITSRIESTTTSTITTTLTASDFIIQFITRFFSIILANFTSFLQFWLNF